MSSACVQRIISPISSSMRMPLREFGLHLHHHTTSWRTTGKQEAKVNQPCSKQIPRSCRENIHQWENKRTVCQQRTQVQHYPERFLTSEESFIVERLLSPSMPLFMITPCQTTSTVCSAAWQQASFNDKCWHWFQNGIFPWSCNAQRTVPSMHLISAEPYCRLLFFFCVSRILGMMSARKTLEVITDFWASLEEELQACATLFWWKSLEDSFNKLTHTRRL